MTILASLNRAYARLPDAAPFGYSQEKIGFLISLNEDGSVANLIDLRTGDGKKKVAPQMQVPQPTKRTAGIAPNFLWDKTSYVLGITAGEGKRVAEEHAAFKDRHLKVLADAEDVGLLALRQFLEAYWMPQRFNELGWTDELKDQNVVFALETDRLRIGYIHDRPASKSLWTKLSAEGDKTSAFCLVTGETGPIARLHPGVKGVWGAQSSGASIVSFNLDAFTSYGHEQGDNAPVSEGAAFAYTTALNKFLETGSKHRIQIGDASTVFWADASNAKAEELATDTFAACSGVNEETQSEKVGAVLTRIRNGEPMRDIAPELDDDVRFCVLGLAPNAARLSIRYWFEDDFKIMAENFRRYFLDIRFEPQPFRKRALTISACILRTAPARIDKGGQVKFDADKISPLVSGELFRAIISGGRFPLSLLSLLVQRIRSDHFLDHIRISLIKANVVRNMRLDGRLTGKEDYLMRSDPDDPNPARRFGRFFALVERAQLASLGDEVNSTLKDKFLGSAAATPQKVFHALCTAVQPHLARLRKGHSDAKWIKDQDHARRIGAALDRDIGKLVASFNEALPAQHSAEEQGLFFIGYYQERFGGKAAGAGTPEDTIENSLENSSMEQEL